jgi:hypothetical protein
MLEYYTLHNPPGIPPRELLIKVGALYCILRNFSITHRLMKNTCVLINYIGNHLITVNKISFTDNDSFIDPENILIPCIIFSYYNPHHCYTFLCCQFPLAPAYATTFHSCQGLTVDHIGVDLTLPVFICGQLYTT